MLAIRKDQKGLRFKVRVQPRSAKNEIVGLYGDALKIRITAPPVGGAANTMCVDFLAKSLKVPKSHVEIVSGQSGRNKSVRVSLPASSGSVVAKLEAAIRSLSKI
jgi:uncharacterized protein (TIGR00251 family)